MELESCHNPFSIETHVNVPVVEAVVLFSPIPFSIPFFLNSSFVGLALCVSDAYLVDTRRGFFTINESCKEMAL